MQTLPSAATDQTQRRAYHSLASSLCSEILNGTVQRDSLDLASRVAAGGLDENRAVLSLFHGVLDMQEKLSRGLLGVRRAADQDTLNELFWGLGS